MADCVTVRYCDQANSSSKDITLVLSHKNDIYKKKILQIIKII